MHWVATGDISLDVALVIAELALVFCRMDYGVLRKIHFRCIATQITIDRSSSFIKSCHMTRTGVSYRHPCMYITNLSKPYPSTNV